MQQRFRIAQVTVPDSRPEGCDPGMQVDVEIDDQCPGQQFRPAAADFMQQ